MHVFRAASPAQAKTRVRGMRQVARIAYRVTTPGMAFLVGLGVLTASGTAATASSAAPLAFADAARVVPASTGTLSPSRAGARIMTTLDESQPAPAGRVSAVSADCPTLSRISACEVRTGRTDITTDGVPTGAVTLLVTIGWHTRIKDSHFNAAVEIKTITAVGDTDGLTEILTARCDSPCFSSGSLVTGPMIPGQAYHGTLSFQDATPTVHSNLAVFTLTPVKPGSTSTPGSGRTHTTIRCDDMLRLQQRAGCVIPAFRPTLTTMSQLPRIAANIRKIQTNGLGHYGRPDSGHPLRRLTDESKVDANRRAVCPRTPPPGHAGDSCDEYPFATTYEGGTALPATDRGIAWVPIGEQRSQGGLINAFNLQNRVLDRDQYWVQV